MKSLNHFHFHPYLIGIFPVFSLYAHNQSQLQPGAPWRSLAVIMLASAITLIVLRLFFKDWHKAAFVTSCALLVFFLYNPFHEAAQNIHSSNLNLGWNRYFLPLWDLILLLGIWLIVKKLPRKESTIQLFNFVALATLLLPSISVISYSISHYSPNAGQPSGSPDDQNVPSVQKRPDIYYIILDMYGRSDAIEDEFGYDNSKFLEQIREQGFYVASCSTTNYSHTVLSISSSLNMNFLPALGDDFVPGNTDYSNADKSIENNAVRQNLKEYGYSFVSFESGFPQIDIPTAEAYIRMPRLEQKISIEPFELLLIEQTPLKMVMDEINSFSSKRTGMGPIRVYGPNYDRTLFMLEKLSQLPTDIPGPKFVYAHLIILPGDHGFGGGPQNRLPILNAYYLPGQGADQLLYPAIAPVNSFRVVLNAYFNVQFELLPDARYLTVNSEAFYDVERIDEDAIECNQK